MSSGVSGTVYDVRWALFANLSFDTKFWIRLCDEGNTGLNYVYGQSKF